MLADRILFIDAEAMVVDKPAGLPVTPTRDGAISVENHLASLAFGFRRWPAPAHRLDRDTSGCLLLARTPRALSRYHAAFEAGQVGKRYLAVVDGVPAQPAGTIDMPLAKISSRADGWRMVADAKGKAARTRWRLVGAAGGRALILFAPETGRTHQLRVHAASGLGLPIAGDPVYGRAARTGMLLHAWRLTVPRDPKAPIVAEAPLPETFAAAGFTAPDIGDGDA
ncbi:MAG: RNA pseudouridine synthase [Sphingomonas fennica]